MSILVINPGSTSTKVALYKGDDTLAAEELQHSREKMAGFRRVADQFDYRMRLVAEFLAKTGTDPKRIRAVVARGGLLRPLEGGVYEVSDAMVDDLQSARYGEHACNLGGVLALPLARHWGVPAYVVDPVVTDEMMDKARLTGLPGLFRRSIFHALNQRGVARMVAGRLGVEYPHSNFIVCHMGGGVSIGAHRRGRVVDVINALDGEGPFTPERTGGLPLVPILDMLHNGERDYAELRTTILSQGGLVAHLGINDPRLLLARVDQGDEHAALVFRAMAYGIARYIVSMAPALTNDEGGLDLAAVVLTGGLARSVPLVEEIARQVSFLGPVEVVPGEVEMAALAQGAVRALNGTEPVRTYRAD
ncbi:putative butyrate kinase 2 [Pseudodesulfovibrio hydrargyri]|uniref:Probable butyrate kinase n=1 Tax=Pseudodesulfovibrio hydrargyri TaxID=2125990 RepID=A0A1J5N4P3_9BACT|nr:butyrate kinase [Pseudodesulfovibrio hydrargyri]OIQ49816.1 putative butyrate kinase 2 [Pseudodesulfovibrio hydrargyri]